MDSSMPHRPTGSAGRMSPLQHRQAGQSAAFRDEKIHLGVLCSFGFHSQLLSALAGTCADATCMGSCSKYLKYIDKHRNIYI